MPLDKRHIAFLNQLRIAYALDEESLHGLQKKLDGWKNEYNQLNHSVTKYIEKEKAQSRPFQSLLVHFTDQVRACLSAKLDEKDIHIILADAFLFSFLEDEAKWEKIRNAPALYSLKDIIQHLKKSSQRNTLGDNFINKGISAFPLEIQQATWHYLRYATFPPLLSQEAISKLHQLNNYLLKRKLGKSINDKDIEILFINTKESYWEKSLLSVVEEDVQEEVKQKRSLYCFTDLFDYLQKCFSESAHETESEIHLPAQWQDPLNVQGLGHQTNLFTEKEGKQVVATQLNDHDFTAICLDLRLPHPYPYIKKAIPILDQQILKSKKRA
ncbi:hypothetical protein [Catalinimonas alkaloidigena]|uniref:hypothetical protein n=1 Tax=Catalinimonas alkaloidigena TaxID=1075417 RepID=UPI002405CBE1|nr:hypothetical protein [Catalinimonas alkaloidigena]